MAEFSEYDRRTSNRAADIMIGLSVGLVVGVAGALLLAPASGRNTRRRIGELADAVSNKANEAVHRAGDALRGRMDQVEQVIEDGRQALRRTKDSITS